MTPSGVPVKMVSLGSRVKKREMQPTMARVSKVKPAAVEAWRTSPLTRHSTRPRPLTLPRRRNLWHHRRLSDPLSNFSKRAPGLWVSNRNATDAAQPRWRDRPLRIHLEVMKASPWVGHPPSDCVIRNRGPRSNNFRS